MKHHTVQSSTIQSIGHDPKSQTMEVTFHRGKTYTYKNVSAGQFKEFKDAPSVGKYFAKFIKGNPTHGVDAPAESLPSKKEKLDLSTRTPLYLEGDGWSIAVSPDAQAIKAELLESAKEITVVLTTAQALVARSQRDDINRMLTDVEKYRTLVKKPVLDKGREIDQCASAFTMDLTAEKLRIDRLLGTFAQAEEEKRQTAAREAQRLANEAARIEQERLAKEQEAERKRLGAERALEEAETSRERNLADKAMKEAEAKQREADELQRQQGQAQLDSYKQGLVVSAPVMKGAAKPTLDFTVNDLAVLYIRGGPEFVELTPKRSSILKKLKFQQDNDLPVGIPGITVKEEWRVR